MYGASGPLPSDMLSIDVVTLEDLLYNMPGEERPQVSVSVFDAATGKSEMRLVPLRAEHIYVVKCDVEGFDVPVLYGLKRLFEAPVAVRPVALTMEFTPRVVAYKSCDALGITAFLYDLGYKYEHDVDVLSLAEMTSLVDASLKELPMSVSTFEGWWKGAALFAGSSSPVASTSPASPVSSPTPVSHSVVSGGHTHGYQVDFCNVTAPAGERKRSVFHAVPPADVRSASVLASSGDAVAGHTMSEYLRTLNESYPCFWANYSIPNGHVVPMCTHDPKVDVGVSGRIHDGGIFFQPTMFYDLRSFMRDGTCPPDRPVVLDLGLNIGSFSLLALELGCQVVAFDMLAINVNRVLQTVSTVRDADGSRWLDRFHGFINGLK